MTNLEIRRIRRKPVQEPETNVQPGVFDYTKSGILPGDIPANDEHHLDGERQFYVYHSARPQLQHQGEEVMQCPYCGRFFWMPDSAQTVHPSCAKRPKYK